MDKILSLDELHEAIITTSAASRWLAVEDIQPVYLNGATLNETTFLAILSISFAELTGRLQADPPIFIQHICPPQYPLALSGAAADLDHLTAAARRLSELLPAPKENFAVQTRILDRQSERPYRPFDINQKLAAVFVDRGYRLDVRNPIWILSVVIAGDTAYLGLSTASQNLSNWAGGQHRFKREPEQISRAEFKLLEAVDVFGLVLAGSGRAMDLGAAPGGWTRLLRRWGYEVWAVDPANLAPQLYRDKKIHHVRQSARQFLSKAPLVELIVNDMRLDVEESAQLMVQAAASLTPHGLAIMTMKLPRQGARQKLETGLTFLEQAYIRLGVRQLFHNRQEVTAVLRKR
jgi:23S rRNA (cytidine2498-2'-O)-methyltransferase